MTELRARMFLVLFGMGLLIPIAGGEVAAGPDEGDSLDAVLLAPARPVFVRFHVRIDGVGFREAWRGHLQQVFTTLDKDGNGGLTGDEAAAGMSWTSLFLGGAVQPDRNRDRLIEAAEWLAALEPLAEPALDAEQNDQNDRRVILQAGMPLDDPSQASKALWNQLDRDGDQSLSGPELLAAPTLLGRLDWGDDELLTASDLAPFQNPLARYFRRGRVQPSQPNPAQPRLVLFSDAKAKKDLGSSLLGRYDGLRRGSPANRILDYAEIDWEMALFARFDRDSSGGLDLEEMTALGKGPPVDLEILIERGSPMAAGKCRPLASPAGQAGGGIGIRENQDGSLTVKLDKLDVQISAPGQLSTADSAKQRFRAADRDQNGYIDEAEARTVPGVSNLFTKLDTNQDGKLFEAEFLGYMQQQAEVARRRISLTATDQGERLFELADGDHDGRLSRRELTGLASNLARWDDGDGQLRVGEVPRQFTITFSSGTSAVASSLGLSQSRLYMGRPPTTARPPAGPAWFQSMDRNGDGDLSPAEFLGEPANFNRLDRDHDGLIDAGEAAPRLSD